MIGTEPIWSAKVSIDEIAEGGSHFDLVADEHVRVELARAAGLRELRRLQASFDVTRQSADTVHISGEVIATVGQNCVVTLEPLESELEERIDLMFSVRAENAASPHGKATVVLEQAEEPEILSGREIDLGAIATEFLLLGIEPYPRKEGAVFEPPAVAEDPAAHPFAALAALKKGEPGETG